MNELWEKHPHVRTGNQLAIRERAADKLKSGFGTWTFLIILNVIFLTEITIHIITHGHWDNGLLLLNLGLSWLAAQQGGALQIAANRGDRISAEVALGTNSNSQKLIEQGETLLELQEEQMKILTSLKQVNDKLDDVKRATE